MFNNALSAALNSMSLHLLLLHVTRRFYDKRSHKNVRFTIKSALKHYKDIMKIKIQFVLYREMFTQNNFEFHIIQEQTLSFLFDVFLSYACLTKLDNRN